MALATKYAVSTHVASSGVDAKLPALATYLGHAQISDVYWYFSVTPELMSIVSERFHTFDTQLDEVEPFTVGLHALPARLSSLTPFGATSLHDAIARTAERVGAREGRRRAVIVFTDGLSP